MLYMPGHASKRSFRIPEHPYKIIFFSYWRTAGLPQHGGAGIITAMRWYQCLCPVLLLFNACTQLFQPTGDGRIPDTAAAQQTLKDHVYTLADTIGERNHYHQTAYDRATDYICRELEHYGYTPERQTYTIPAKPEYKSAAGKTAVNIEARKPGTDPSAPWLIIGAHYDTRVGMKRWNVHGPVIEGKTGTPGANDNASGVAAMLYLAKQLRNVPTKNGIIFVAYANEEAPFFQTDEMGSRRHARRIVAELGKENIMGMFTTESMGIYSPRSNKKRRSAIAGSLVGILDRCDYVAFMSTFSGKAYSRDCAKVFASVSRFPVRSVVFGYLTRGIAWSDDWSYMKEGIPAFAVTDTAYMRCDDYHETSDTADKLDYREFAEVCVGVEAMVRKLTGTQHK